MTLNADSSDDEYCLMSSNRLNADSSEDEGGALDSSDDEGGARTEPILKSVKKGGALDSSDDEGEAKSESTQKKGGALDSSDDEDGHNVNDSSRKKLARIVDSSDEEGVEKEQPEKDNSDVDSETVEQKGGSNRKKKIGAKCIDSDSEDDAPKPKANIFKNKDLYDAESSDDEPSSKQVNADSSDDEPSRRSGSDESRHSGESDGESHGSTKKKVHEEHVSKKERQGRNSKSSAINEIRSESQRMLRESSVGLPYHRPKQRSLQEFLERKKGTPEIIHSIKSHNFSVADGIALQEREKKLEEFYKSDEEDAQSDPEDGEFKIDEHNEADDVDMRILNTVDVIDEEKVEVTADNRDTSETAIDAVHQVENEVVPSCETEPQIHSVIGDSEISEDTPGPVAESLNLILEETLEIDQSLPLVKEKPKTRRERKLEALKNQIENGDLEETLNITPKLGSSKDELFSPVNNMSPGAKKLFSRFVLHAQATGLPGVAKTSSKDEDVNIVTKTVNADGENVLELQKVHIKRNDVPKESNTKRVSLKSFKENLKREMLESKLDELKKREELTKLNNEEFGEELPDEDFDGEMDDNEEADDEDMDAEDEESEPEEDDILVEDKKTKRGLFVDNEAEESGDDEEDSEDELSDTDSLNLVQEDEDSATKKTKSKSKSGFSKIKNSNLLSDDSNSMSTPLPNNFLETETPNTETASIHSMAGSTASSTSSFFNTVPRWTPFKDRLNSEGVEICQKESTELASPTASQMAKKKLGFEGLFDASDPDVEGIDDVVGLCSGKFATQAGSDGDISALFTQPFPAKDNVDSANLDQIPCIESQDTVILTGAELSEERGGVSDLDDLLGLESSEAAPGFMEDNLGAGRILDSDDDEDLLVTKKRKRAVISDDEESEADGVGDHSEDDDAGSAEEDEDEVESEKDEQPKRKSAALFDKKGRLRKDFLENEAELSGSDEEYEDEDEHGLDRLELEAGDLDDIDEDDERDKVGRIHQKVLLDQDQADIRLFQERFLEDGDLHTDNKRQRQFKWKGLDEDLEMDRRDSDGEEEEQVDGEDENWRVQRLEREKWLKENQQNAKSTSEPETKFFRLAEKAMEKISCKKDGSESEEKTTTARTTGPLQPLFVSNRESRSSFLARGQSSLEKMAIFNKKSDDRSGSGAKKSARNFVFAALSPEKPDLDPQVEPQHTIEKQAPPAAKRTKLDRTLKANNRPTIFNLL